MGGSVSLRKKDVLDASNKNSPNQTIIKPSAQSDVQHREPVSDTTSTTNSSTQEGNSKDSLSAVLMNGTIYEGDFKNGLRDGKGVLKLASGAKYVGEFQRNVYHGHGTFYSSDGERYVGDWVWGVRQGRGMLLLPKEQIKYEGEFFEGEPHGYHGLWTSERDGWYFYGSFAGGCPVEGDLIFKDGRVLHHVYDRSAGCTFLQGATPIEEVHTILI